MYIVTTADKTVHIGQDYTDNLCDIKASGTDLYYITNPATTDVIRTGPDPVQTATSDLDDTTAAPSFDFTVADSSIFRIGEVLGWYATDGTTRKGSLRVESLPDSATTAVLVRCRYDKNEGEYVAESGDKLQYLPDTVLSDGDSIVVKISRSTKMLVRASAASSIVNMVVTRLDSTVQKKN